jgi:choice-of-anchor B domain-containing protein
MTLRKTSKTCLLLGFLALAGLPASGQKVVNMSLVSQLDLGDLGASGLCNVGATTVAVNEVWGWDGPAGEALALVGLCDGTAIIDMSDPAAPVLLPSGGGPGPTVPGPLSVWRDVKTFDHYAYIVHDVLDPDDPEGAGVGVQIVDLAGPAFPVVATLADGFTRAHNLYVDEARGHLYVIGWDPDAAGFVGAGFHPEHSDEAGFSHGFRIYDLSADPEDPSLLGTWDERYVHDLHVRGETAYAAALDEGLWFIDVSDPASPATIDHVTYTQTLGAGSIDQFTHNVWVDEAGAVAAVTDEEMGQRLKLFDVADPAAVTKVSEYEAKLGILPHNAFILGGRAYVSYYSEGAVILDITDPAEPCEIGYYDTYLGASAMNGAWGIYPFTASGLIYLSDISNGFHVLEFEPPSHEPVDVALVLDVSGSMSSVAVGGVDPKIEVLKDAVEIFVQTWRAFADPQDRMGIVYFESGIETAFIDGSISTRFCPHHADFLDDLEDRSPGNLTALGGGLLTGLRSFEAGPRPKVAIVVTDGMQNRSPMVVEAGIEFVFFDLGDTLVEVTEIDCEHCWPSLDGAEEMVTDLKAAGVGVGIISDTPPGWDDDDVRDRMENPAFLDEFEVVVLSSLEGVSKPDPAVFELALDRLAIRPPVSHVAFVTEALGHIADDEEAPTEGARAVGMVGIHLGGGPPDPRADHTAATPAAVADVVLGSALPERHEILTVPSGPGIFGDSGVPGEPGTPLAELGATVHTIGVGTAPGEKWQDLIEDLAAETGGLHHFTSAPDADLVAFLEDDLVAALQSGSVYRVARAVGTLETGEGQTLTFALNPTVSKLVVRLSWRNAGQRAGLRPELRPDGAPEAIPASHRFESETYRIDTWKFPLWDGKAQVEAGGEWRLTLRGSGGPTGGITVPYSAALLVDDPHLETRFEVPAGALAAGRSIPLAGEVRLDGRAVADVEFAVEISGPESGLGTALVELGPDRAAWTPGTEAFDPVDLRLRELMERREFRERLQGGGGSATLGETAEGRYTGAFTPEVPGSYRFDWRATGAVEGRPFERSGTAFRDVGLAELSATRFELLALNDSADRFRLTVVPIDALGNFLGPGHADRIRASVPGVGALLRFEDRFDGSYRTDFQVSDPGRLYGATVVVGREAIPLPAAVVRPLAERRVAVLSLHLGSAHPDGDLGAVATDGYSLGVDLHRDLRGTGRFRWRPGLRLNASRLEERTGGDLDIVALHSEVQRAFGPGGTALQPFLEVGVGIDFVDGGSGEPGAHAGAGLTWKPAEVPWRLELAVRLFDTLSGSPDGRVTCVQLGWVQPLL